MLVATALFVLALAFLSRGQESQDLSVTYCVNTEGCAGPNAVCQCFPWFTECTGADPGYCWITSIIIYYE
jgi:hypothetical protein